MMIGMYTTLNLVRTPKMPYTVYKDVKKRTIEIP